ncbi:hypothetical protein SLEP1_g49803 [Rubroshorea leprosula]|uniref:Uncharacterized protein n=1 Tax=Rubroshorea leprosula TaxID=152421 RepID=A0AAV5LXZ0_9ROSI|nr:hypothetical protein SLEP1_g49803 [Rubroshorea leprosula]
MREDEAAQNLFADEDQRDAASQICRRTRTASVFLLSSCVALKNSAEEDDPNRGADAVASVLFLFPDSLA